jgi:hypothetical protein
VYLPFAGCVVFHTPRRSSNTLQAPAETYLHRGDLADQHRSLFATRGRRRMNPAGPNLVVIVDLR